MPAAKPAPIPTPEVTRDQNLQQKTNPYFKSPLETSDQYTARTDQYLKERNPTEVKTEPAVISASSVDQEVAQNKEKLASMAKKGTSIGTDGAMKLADGSVAGAPEGSTFNETSGKYEYGGKTYSAAEFYDGNNTDEDYNAVQKIFEPLKASTDAATLSTINAIHSQFNAYRSAQEDANQSAEKSGATALMRAGGRYAPMNTSGQMLAQTSFGLRQLQTLDDKENAAIGAAKAAQETQDYKIMADSLSMAEGIRKEKQSKAQEVLKKVTDANQKIAEQKYQSSRDSAIADLVAQGIHDPSQMLNLLNTYEDGSDTGGDFTSDEVAKALKNLTVDGDPKNLAADLQTFNYLRDHIGLPEEIAKLPPAEQYFAYLQSIKGSTGGFSLSPGEARYDGSGKLIAARAPKPDPNEAPSWDEYLTAAKKAAGVSYFPNPDEDMLKKQYEADFPNGKVPTKFSDAETRRLEQAGLLDSSRPEQLDFLYKKQDDLSMPTFE